MGIGDAGVLQKDGGGVRSWNTLWLYAEDAWRLHERLTLTYGLGWGIDGILNHDLHKPILLAPILGVDGLGPTRNNWTNFSPVVGMAWTPSPMEDCGSCRRRPFLSAARPDKQHGRRKGCAWSARSRPPESRRKLHLNCVPGIPGLRGVPARLPQCANTLHRRRCDGGSFRRSGPASPGFGERRSDRAQIQINKQASPAIFPVEVPNPSAVHVNAGVQRELARGIVLSADVVYRHFDACR